MAKQIELFELQRFGTMQEVREAVRGCEGRHAQQVAYSTYHDALTQVCFGCMAVRTSVGGGEKEAARERPSERVMRELDEEGVLDG